MSITVNLGELSASWLEEPLDWDDVASLATILWDVEAEDPPPTLRLVNQLVVDMTLPLSVTDRILVLQQEGYPDTYSWMLGGVEMEQRSTLPSILIDRIRELANATGIEEQQRALIHQVIGREARP